MHYQLLFRRIITALSLLSYLGVTIANPLQMGAASYQNRSVQTSAKSNESASPNDRQNISNQQKKLLSQVEQFAQTGAKSFQSQASNGEFGVGVSVNSSTLSLDFSQKIVGIKASAISSFSFPLSIVHGSDYNDDNKLIADHDLSLNIPYLQLRSDKGGKQYYNLSAGSRHFPFVVNSGSTIQFLYQAPGKDDFHFAFTDNNTAVLTLGTGVKYIFKKSTDYLYRCVAQIGTDGRVIYFEYGSTGTLKILNNAKKMMAVVLKPNSSQAEIMYIDNRGKQRTFSLVQNGADVAITDPLNQVTNLSFSNDDNINNIRLANGAYYSIDYGVLDKTHYIVDGETVNVDNKTDYVKSYTKHLLNRYSQDQTYQYTVNPNGNNFAGNNISCSKKLFDNLQPLQDWVMECGFDRKAGMYRYSTEESVNIPVFTGSTAPESQPLKTVRSYNYLHLPETITTSVNNKSVAQTQNIYSDKINSAKSMADLGASYTQPVRQVQKIYNDQGSQDLSLVSDFSYNTEPTSHGELQSIMDPYGNQQKFTYYPRIQGVYQNFPQSETTNIYGNNDDITTEYGAPNTLSKTVEVNGQNYTLKVPYVNEVINHFNGKQKSKSNLTYDIDPNSITFGMPIDSTKASDNNPAFVKNMVKVEQDGDNYIIWNEKHSLTSDSKGDVPQSIQSVKKYYNAYGGLSKTVDPITNDTVIYDSYDALGRITQLSYLPGGNRDNKQVYRYQYKLIQGKAATDQAGFGVTTTMVTPTTGDKGYSIQRYYDSDNHLVKEESQLADRSGFFTTHEYYYNAVGKVDHSVGYYYDETGNVHPQTTRYFYDKNQDLTAVQKPDGSTSVTVNDPYNLRKLTYVLQPTGTEITDKNSLCFDPLQSTPDHTVYNSCKVTSVAVERAHAKNLAPQSDRPLWVSDASYHYRIILDPGFQYTDKTGAKVPLYNATLAAAVKNTMGNLSLGKALDLAKLKELANTIKQGCLSGQCSAGGFSVTHLDSLKRPYFTEDTINNLATKQFYNENQPDQVLGQTVYLKKDNGALNPIKTLYYSYDHYGNRTKVETASGDYNPLLKKTLVGERAYTSLGYLLNATSLVNTPDSQVNIKYDSISGLPIEIIDALGNKVVTHYDNKIWRNKPSQVDYYQANGKKDFTINYNYNANGGLAAIAKYNGDTLIDKTKFSYDPITTKLIKTEMTGANGQIRSLRTQTNNYFATQASTYKADGHAVYQEKYHTNPLGLPIKTDYTGAAEFSVGATYSPDLSLKDSLYNNQVSQSYTYNTVGQLTTIGNTVNGKLLRNYQYGYNRLGKKSMQIASTENSDTTTQLYDYSNLGQLSSFSCTGNGCPNNQFGQKIQSIVYNYNNLFNTLASITQQLADNKTQKINYSYQNTDPTQVSAIDYSGKGKTTLKYDNNGNVIAMKKLNKDGGHSNYQMNYDSQQNLTGLTIDKKQIDYSYGANGSQIDEVYKTPTGKQQTLYQYYLGGLSEQSLDNESRYYVTGGSIYHNEYQRDLTDGFHITGSEQNEAVDGDYVYTPFGAKSDLQNAQNIAISLQKTTLSYRMMNTDQITHWQFLGNGYRAYNPELRLFMKHDNASPWSVGGINGYGYADNDPVNGFDPSGHATNKDINHLNTAISDFANSHVTPWWQWLIIGVSALAAIGALIPTAGTLAPITESILVGDFATITGAALTEGISSLIANILPTVVLSDNWLHAATGKGFLPQSVLIILSLMPITFSTVAGFASAANIASEAADAETMVNVVAENTETSIFSKARSLWKNRTTQKYLKYMFSREYAPHKIVFSSFYRDFSLIAKNTMDYVLKPIWKTHKRIVPDDLKQLKIDENIKKLLKY